MTLYIEPYCSLPYTYSAWYALGCMCVVMPPFDHAGVERERTALFIAGWYSGEWLPYEGDVHTFRDSNSLFYLKVTDTLVFEGDNTFCCWFVDWREFSRRQVEQGFAPAIPINCESHGWHKPLSGHDRFDEWGFALSYLLWDRDFQDSPRYIDNCWYCGTPKDPWMLDCPECGNAY